MLTKDFYLKYPKITLSNTHTLEADLGCGSVFKKWRKQKLFLLTI